MRCLGVQSVSKTSLVIFKSHVRCLGVAGMSVVAGHWTCHHHVIIDGPLAPTPFPHSCMPWHCSSSRKRLPGSWASASGVWVCGTGGWNLACRRRAQCICHHPCHFQSDAIRSGGFFETEEDYCAALTDGGFGKALQARIVVYRVAARVA